ncbi:hypothetical protein P5G51_005770 [Virgibacillus sp. 179-BFC.A HS]|uniref:Uncharacterized protein n=1 Tax=Tigheibacillus jepli TaxID=3035914 RepID=A0ABU5CF68_9BACI|nr:hypothetical protein [Virgibacillus sp. 179-BFC.A HS]MDY0404973.1 hypothetical protein [Virgibacillus sp. 179-BFC.A HS]
MNKLTRNEANLLQKVLEDNDHVIEVNNKRYYVSVMEEPRTLHETKKVDNRDVQRYKTVKNNILKGKEFSIDDVVEMIDMGIM